MKLDDNTRVLVAMGVFSPCVTLCIPCHHLMRMQCSASKILVMKYISRLQLVHCLLERHSCCIPEEELVTLLSTLQQLQPECRKPDATIAVLKALMVINMLSFCNVNCGREQVL